MLPDRNHLITGTSNSINNSDHFFCCFHFALSLKQLSLERLRNTTHVRKTWKPTPHTHYFIPYLTTSFVDQQEPKFLTW